jgi:MoaA/NifB/PqqE/SkfB family radical SAM enzyme
MTAFKNELKQYVRTDIPLQFNEINILKKHWSRTINIFNGEILPPYEILIHTSSICNLSCKWCIGSFVSKKSNSDKLLPNNLYDIDNMKFLVDSIIKYQKLGKNYDGDTDEKLFRIENVSFSGITGEPMMAKESLLYAIEKLSESNIRVGIFTNGALMTEDMMPTLVKMGYILISIDAGTSSTYSNLKCNSKNLNTFEILLNNIKLLNEYKKKCNSSLDINVGYIINQYNYNEMYKLAKVLKEIGVHYLRFKTDIASIMNMTDDQKTIAKQEILRIQEDLEDNDFKIVEIHDVLNDKMKVRLHEKCFVHYLVANVSSDGNVYPCNYHPKQNGYNYGSVLENDFSLLWNDIFKNEVDKLIPNICPSVCDPFKNRANKLLEEAYKIYKEKGYDYLKKCVDDIKLEA